MGYIGDLEPSSAHLPLAGLLAAYAVQHEQIYAKHKVLSGIIIRV